MVAVLILPFPIVVFLTTWSTLLLAICFFMFTSYTTTPNTGRAAMTTTITFYTIVVHLSELIFFNFSNERMPDMPKRAMTNGKSVAISNSGKGL